MHSKQDFTILVAVSKNGVIGSNNTLLWHIGEDLKRFKALTINNTVIMGRKTYESLPFKPLPNRRNIVLTNNIAFSAEGVEICTSLEEVLQKVAKDEKVFIIGGGVIYKLFVPYCNKAYVTEVLHEFSGDTFFDIEKIRSWNIMEDTQPIRDEKSGLCYRYVTYSCEPPLKNTNMQYNSMQ